MWSLPSDLKRYTRRKVLKRVVPCILLFALLGYVLLVHGEEILGTHKTLAKIICYPIILLMPFAITGVPFKMMDSSWTGEILRVDAKEEVAFHGAKHMYAEIKVLVTIKKDDGKIITHKVIAAAFPKSAGFYFTPKGNVEMAINRFSIGAKVCHLYGTKHIVVMPSASDTTVLCPVCADVNDKEERVCRSCGHSLIKDIRLSEYRKKFQ